MCALSAPVGGTENGTISVSIHAGPYEIRGTCKGHEIVMKDFGRLLVPGKPDLPSKIIAIAVPPGAEVTSVAFDWGEGFVLPGKYRIPPAPLPRVIGHEDSKIYGDEKKEYQLNYNSTYKSNNPYPRAVGDFVRTGRYRKYKLVDVRITPFVYHPQSGRLVHYPKVKICVDYSLDDGASRSDLIIDGSPRTEAIAREIIANYDQVQGFYGGDRTLGNSELYDFVIITLPSLTESVTSLADWEGEKGRGVKVVTTEWIHATYKGVDLAQEIRNFLREKYPSGAWGVEDVLLVGHYDDVPMRRTAQNAGYGAPETDYYYAELSLPDSESWDLDEDGNYGEDSDPIDFYAEVNVGRIPWSEPGFVENICLRSVAFEQNNDPSFKKSILLLGAFFWADTDNAVLMEAKVNQPWMSDWMITRMYEKNENYWSSYPCDHPLVHRNVMDVWPTGKYAFVNWAGHGTPTSSRILGLNKPIFVRASDCPLLNNDYPAIIFADACSNSDTDFLNIGQAMLAQGAVGFVGANKIAYGMPGWDDPSDGSSQSMDYFFTTYVTSGEYTQGEAHQKALRTMYASGLWFNVKYAMFEWGSLWGNPDLRLDLMPPLRISFPEGLPENVQPPGPQTKITLGIEPGSEGYVPGTGFLYYRFNPEDPYTAIELPHLQDNLFEGVLPNTEPGDQPQFYFCAQGDGGSTVYSPAGAPAEGYSFNVCFLDLMVHDDFESNTGWTIEKDDLSTGLWECADPNGTEYNEWPAQPEEDNPYGKGNLCYITQNGNQGCSADEADVDGGPTRLVSPTIDLSSGDAEISFYCWYFNNNIDDPLTVDISNDDGATWKEVMRLDHSPGWKPFRFTVSDTVTPTAGTKVRFNAQDNPDNSVTEAGVDDFKVELLNFTPTLWADNYFIPVGTTGRVTLMFQGESSLAGKDYLVLGGRSGYAPGMELGGYHVPLNVDSLSFVILENVNSLVFQNFEGVLDSTGGCTPVFHAVKPVPNFLQGIMITFVLIVMDGPRSMPLHHASNHINVIFQ